MTHRSLHLVVVSLLLFVPALAAQTIDFVDKEGNPTSEILEGGLAYVRLVDPGSNWDPGWVESFYVLATATYSQDETYVYVQETGRNTGIFQGTLQLDSPWRPGLVTSNSGAPDYFPDEVTLDFPSDPKTATVRPATLGLFDDFVPEAAELVVGQDLGLRVVDQNLNDPSAADTVQVLVESQSSGDSELVVLDETGLDTGVFEGSIATVAAPVSSGDGVLSAQTGETVRATHDHYGDPGTETADAMMRAVRIFFIDAEGQPASTYMENSIAYMRLVDFLADQYPQSPDTVFGVIESQITGDQEMVFLDETGDSTGIFVGSMELSVDPGVSSSWNGVLATSELQGPPHQFDTLTASFDEGSIPETAQATAVTTGSTVAFLDAYGNEVTSYAVGTTLYLRVVDQIANVDAYTMETVVVDLQALTGGDYEQVTLQETDFDTSVFETMVPLGTGAATSLDGILQASSGDTVRASHDDDLGFTQATAQVAIEEAALFFIDSSGAVTFEVLEGGVARIRLQSPGDNLDPGAVESVTLEVESFYYSDFQSVDVTETGVDTGVFEGEVQLVSSTKPGLLTSNSGAPDYLPDVVTVRYPLTGGGEVSASAPTRGARIYLINDFGQVTGSYALSESVRVRVIDQNLNSPLLAESFPVMVTSLTSGDSEMVPVTETGLDTGVYEGWIATTSSSSTPGDGLLGVSLGETVEATHPHSNDPLLETAQARIAGSAVYFLDAAGQPVTTYLEASTVYLRVIDSPADLNPYSPDTVSIGLGSYITSDSETLYLTETGSSTGVFEGSMPLTVDPVSWEDGFLSTSEFGPPLNLFDRVTASYYDTSGAFVDVTVETRGSELHFLDASGHEVSSYAVGSTVYLRVVDHPANADPWSTEAVSVSVYGLAGGDEETISCLEKGSDTGVFEGTLALGRDPVTVGDDVLQAGPEETIEARHDDYFGYSQSVAQAVIEGAAVYFLDAAGDSTATYMRGSTVYLRVLDFSADLSPSSTDTVSVVVDAALSGDSETVTLTETGASTGTFEGQVPLDVVPPTPGNGVLETSELYEIPVVFDTLTVTYDGSSGTKTGTASIEGSRIAFLDAYGNEVTSYAVGSTAYLWIEDHVANTDPASYDEAYVELYAQGSGDWETLFVLETGLDTGVFLGSIPLGTGSATQSDGVLQTSSDDTIELRHDDPASWNQALVLATIEDVALSFVDESGAVTFEVLEGGVARMRLFSLGDNADPASADQVGLWVSSLYGLDSAYVNFLETGVDTSVFEGEIQLASPWKSGLVTSNSGSPQYLPDVVTVAYPEWPDDITASATTRGARVDLIDGFGRETAVYGLGQPVHVRVVDDNRNDATSIDTTSVTVESLGLGDVDTVTLTETGLDTGVFEGLILTTGDDPVLQTEVGETIRATYPHAGDPGLETAEASVAGSSVVFLDAEGGLATSCVAASTVYVRVTDLLADLDSFSPDTVAVELDSYLAGDVETLFLTETGNSTGVFEGSMPMDIQAASPGDGVLSSSEYTGPPHRFDTLTAVYDDQSGTTSTATAETLGSITTFVDAGGHPVASYMAGTTLYLRVEDGAANGDPFTPDVSDALVVDLTSGDQEILTLVETGADTDVFEGSLPLGTGGVALADDILQASAGDTIEAYHTDYGYTESTAQAYITELVNSPPVVLIDQPADGEVLVFGLESTFSASAIDPEDGDISSWIDWSSDLDGALGSGAVLATSTLSAGVHTITASVVDSLGGSGSDSITVTVNQEAVVTISSPADGAVFTYGTEVTFTGTATDPEDGDLTAGITWTSSVDGVFGTGGSVATSSLSAGPHTITAEVTDVQGLTSSESVSITINVAPVVTITAPADGSSSIETEPVTFTGTASDAEDGDLTASIHWTSSLDGALGTGGSFNTSSLSVGVHTITASVADSQGAPASASITYTVSANVAPTVTITAPANGSVFLQGTSVGFTGTAADPEDGDLSASLGWTSSLDGAIGIGASAATSSLSVGVHTITASVTDSHGDPGSAVITVTIHVAPTVSILSPADGSSSTETDPVSFTGTASDAEDGDLTASIAWTSSLDGAIGTGGTVNTSSLSVGVHTITASVTDNEGAPASASITYTVNANVAPTVTITAPADGSVSTEGTSVTFTGTATDPEDGDLAASLAWASSVDGAIGTGASVNTSTLSAGAHTITASVTDSHGAPGSASITVTINVAPTVLITSPADGSSSTETDPVSFTGTASDAEDGDRTASIAWTSSLDGALGTGGTLNTSSLSVGVHTITASVTDSEGAPASVSMTYTVNANVAPTVAITVPSSGSVFLQGTSVGFTGTASDPEDGDLAANLAWTSSVDGAIGTGASVSTSALSAGAHTITASVTDSHGAPGSAAITVTINVAPTVSITSPVNGSVFLQGTSAGFTGTATDPEEGDLAANLAWTSSVDGAIGSGASVSTSALSPGTHTITASVTDSHGAPGSASITVTINVAPTVLITSPATGSSSTETDPVTFSGTATDPEDGNLAASLVWTSTLDGAIGSGGSFATSSLSIGTHTITASVTDSHGAPGSAAIVVTVNPNTAPVVAILTPSDGQSVTVGDLVTFTGSAVDAQDGDLSAALTWTSSRDGVLGTGSSVATSSLSIGSHTITASVTDSHGAPSAASISILVRPQPVQVTFTSIGPEDGRVEESSENSNVGGKNDSVNSTGSALRVGDDRKDKQYKSFVSFDTSSIPDGAEVQSVTLRLVRGTVDGTDPFTTHGTCRVDIRTGGFNGSTSLEDADFEAPATAAQVATMSSPAADGDFSEGVLDAAGLLAINKTGTTQLRIYFDLDDNNDRDNDYMGFHSGDDSDPSLHPQLVVIYQE